MASRSEFGIQSEKVLKCNYNLSKSQLQIQQHKKVLASHVSDLQKLEIIVKCTRALLQSSLCEEWRARLQFSCRSDFKGSIISSLDLADKVFLKLGCTGMSQKHQHQVISDGKSIANI